MFLVIRIETSRWPAALFAGLAAVLLGSEAPAKDIKSKTINCGLPGALLALAIILTLAVPADAEPLEDGAAAAKRGDYETALRIWRPLAEHGDAEAQYNLGFSYANGEGVPQDYAEALKWYRKAAERDHAGAQFNLGVMHDRGEGIKRNRAEAATWYREAAEQGHAGAQFNLGVMYEKGDGVPQDYAEAVKWYSNAAEQDFAMAQVNLGGIYANGRGVPQDFVLAHPLFSLAAAAGTEGAGTIRDAVARLMTPDQIAEAQRLARQW